MKKKIIIMLAFVGVLFSIFSCTNLNAKDINTDAKIEETEEATKTTKKSVKTYNGWIKATSLNVRSKPSTSSKIVGHLSFNKKVVYSKVNSNWYKIKYKNKDAYIRSKYVSNKKVSSKLYTVPKNNGFKSYMSYKSITSKSSPQYKLQNKYAVTGKYGIRTVNGRYCIALGSAFTKKIGQYVDLILKNGTVIPCILADSKADIHTDSSNMITKHNGCVSEFVVNTKSLNKNAKRDGDISSCTKKWDSPVAKIRVYNKNVFNN